MIAVPLVIALCTLISVSVLFPVGMILLVRLFQEHAS